MRRLTIFLVLVLALFSGYWLFVARSMTTQTTAVLDDMAAQGWDIQYTDLGTNGFPVQFNAQITQASLAAPDGSVAWTAPEFQVSTPSYWPAEITATFPSVQTLTVSGQAINILTESLTASAAVDAATALPLSNVTIYTQDLMIASQAASLTLASGRLTVDTSAQDATVYDVALTLAEITLPADITELTNSALPNIIDGVTGDISVMLNKSIDRFAGEGAAVRPTAADLRDITLIWGDVQVNLTGTVTIDSQGQPSGALQLTLVNWQILIDAAVAAELLDQQTSATALAALRGMSGGSNDVTLPISLNEGAASMGFIPLGQVDLWD